MAVPIVLVAALCLIFTQTISASPMSKVGESSTVCNTQACKDAAVLIQNSLDLSADPCQDFYQYACGGWIAKNPIPDDKTKYSSFDVLRDQLAESVSDLLRGENTTESDRLPKAVKTKKAVPNAVKAAETLFRGCINEEAREKEGVEPLKCMLKKYGGFPMIEAEWNETEYLWYLKVARMLRDFGKGSIITVSIDVDAKNTTRHIIYVGQATFGLGRNQLIGRNSSERNEQLVAAYKEYIIATAQLLNPKCNKSLLHRDTEDIMEFESSLAKLTKSPEEQRNASTMYNKMTVKELQNLTQEDSFDWKAFLNTLFEKHVPVTDDTEVVISDVDYVKNAIKLARNTKIRTLANYVGSQIAASFGSQTTKEYRQKSFQFQKVKSGIQKMPKLHIGCMDLAVNLFEFSVGRLYVDRYFPEEAKHDVENMVREIYSAYFATLKNSTWLDEATRSQALDKLESMISMMAYPQWIKNDNKLNEYYKEVGELREEKYFASLRRAYKAIVSKTLEKINKPTNRTSEWVTSPAIVNAFYNPSANTITFPAGILNSPFYKYSRATSLNFGGIGSVIGHEVSHGFDDQGSQFDKDGNINNWWSQEIREKFEEKAQCYKDQYSSYTEPMTQMKLNGNNSIGENIADNAGLQSSYNAYKLKSTLSAENGTENKRLPGISATRDQLFFIGYANIWCGSERKESMEMTIQYNTHSPGRYRVIVPLSNFKAFSEAFNCPLGSPMNPEAKCTLW